jgi:hypothetical protein
VGKEVWKKHFTKASDIKIAQNELSLVFEGKNLLAFGQDFETWWCSANPLLDINGIDAREDYLSRLDQSSRYIGPIREKCRRDPPATYELLCEMALEIKEDYAPTVFRSRPTGSFQNPPHRGYPFIREERRVNNHLVSPRATQIAKPAPAANKHCANHPNSKGHTTAECLQTLAPGSRPAKYGYQATSSPARSLRVVATDRTTREPFTARSTESYVRGSQRKGPFPPQRLPPPKLKTVTCFTCQQVGHFASACTNKSRSVARVIAQRPAKLDELALPPSWSAVIRHAENQDTKFLSQIPRVLSSLPEWNSTEASTLVSLDPPASTAPTAVPAEVEQPTPQRFDPFVLSDKPRPKQWADWSDTSSDSDLDFCEEEPKIFSRCAQRELTPHRQPCKRNFDALADELTNLGMPSESPARKILCARICENPAQNFDPCAETCLNSPTELFFHRV